MNIAWETGITPCTPRQEISRQTAKNAVVRAQGFLMKRPVR